MTLFRHSHHTHQLPALTRRELLSHSLRGAFVLGSALSASQFLFPGSAQAIDWKSLWSRRPTGGHATVKELEGVALGAYGPLKLGDRIESGTHIQCTQGARMVLHTSDNTVMQLSGETQLDLQLDGRGRGVMRLLLGAVLTVVPTNHRYLVEGPTATIGIKGTVFYRQFFAPGDQEAYNMGGKRVEVPQNARDYVCTCNGQIEYLQPRTLYGVLSEAATHHNAYFLDEQNPLQLGLARNAINHNNDQIRHLIGQQAEPRHDADWLK